MNPLLLKKIPPAGDVRGSRTGDETDEGRKGTLDKDTIVRMGIAWLYVLDPP